MSTYNATYKRLYNVYQRNSLWVNDIFGVFRRSHVERRFQPIFQRELEKEYFTLYPRRRKFDIKKLSEEDVNRVRERVVPLALAYIESRALAMKDIVSKMYALAPKIDLTPVPEMVTVKESDTSTYNSQGMGKNKYARSALKEAELLLERAGFTIEVREILWTDVLEDTSLRGVFAYQLWANAEPYMLDALQKMDKRSSVERAAEQWKNGVNPAVYNPFLSSKDFDTSLKLAGWD